jgi:hypothetical protein
MNILEKIKYQQELSRKGVCTLVINNIGKRVFVRSNEDEPILVCDLIGVDFITKAQDPVPVIQRSDGKQFLTMGIVAPYTKELELIISKMNHKEQWSFLSNYNINVSGHKSTRVKDEEQKIVAAKPEKKVNLVLLVLIASWILVFLQLIK